MLPPPAFMDELKAQHQRFLDISPLKDFEKNARTWSESMFSHAIVHFNLVQRSEMDNTNIMLEKAIERINELEARLEKVEQKEA